MRVPRPSAVVLAVVALVACARLTPASGVAPSSSEQPAGDLAASASPTPWPTQSYQPDPDLTEGTVVRRTAGGGALSPVGNGNWIDLRPAVGVWRDTSGAAN